MNINRKDPPSTLPSPLLFHSFLFPAFICIQRYQILCLINIPRPVGELNEDFSKLQLHSFGDHNYLQNAGEINRLIISDIYIDCQLPQAAKGEMRLQTEHKDFIIHQYCKTICHAVSRETPTF